MATWEDGPEYAPVERPAEFTPPPVEPLDVAPPPPQPAALPVQRPLFTDPPTPVAPLAALVPAPADDRDPQIPFTVVSSNLTSGSAWGSAHHAALAATPAFPAAAPVVPGAGGFPAAAAWNPGWAPGAAGVPAPWSPAAASPPPQFPPTGPFPAPGTPQWFGPGPYREERQPAPVDAGRVLRAATPGLLVVLGTGALVFLLSPVMLVVAFILSNRVTAGRDQVRRALGVALAVLGFFALVGLTRAPVGFGEWWSYAGLWGLLICWVMLGTVTALVYRALKRGTTDPPPPLRGDWR